MSTHRPRSGLGWDVCRFTFVHLRVDKLRVAGAMAGMLTYVVLTVASTVLIGRAVDEAGHPGNLSSVLADLAGVLGVLVGAVIARWFADRAMNAHTSDAMAKIVRRGFTKVQAFATHWHADNFAGASARKITRAAQGYDMFVSCWYFFFLPSIFLVLVTSVTIAGASLGASVALLVGSAAYFAVTAWYNTTRVMPRLAHAFAQDSRITGEVVDVLGNNAAVKAWASEDREDRRFGSLVDHWSETLTGAWNMAVNGDQLQTLVSAVVLVVPIAIVVVGASRGTVDTATVATVIGSGFVLRGWLGNIGRGVREAQNAASEMAEMIDLLKLPSEAEEDRGKQVLVPSLGAIRFERVRFRYIDGGQPVFNDLSMTIEAGQTVALVGPSGGGKSSFVRLLLGLYQPQGGSIFIDGQDIERCTRESVRRAIALVPQDPALFHRSLSDNIVYGAPEAEGEALRDAARRARLEDMIHDLPSGYGTLVGERGIKLSGGERQRVAIARALLSDRPILVFDEATSSLDTENERAIQQALQIAMKGRTTIIVAHRLSTVRNADRILVFSGGQIVEDGTHDQLSNRQRGIYAQLLAGSELKVA